MSQEKIEQELGKSRLKVNVLFAVDTDEYLKVAIIPGFADDLSQEEEAKATGLMAFITGLINEGRGEFEYFQQRGIALAQTPTETVDTSDKEQQLNLQFMEVKGNA